MIHIGTSIIVFLMIGIPFIFLLKKAGLSPYWSALFLLSPFGVPLGGWIAFPMLALRAWPAKDEIQNPYFFSVPYNVGLVLIHVLMPIFSLYVIFKKAGYSGWWCLSILVPPMTLVMLWVVAFRDNHIKNA